MKKASVLMTWLLLGMGCSDSNLESALSIGTIVDFKDNIYLNQIYDITQKYHLDLHPNSKVFALDKITISDKSLSNTEQSILLESGLVENVESNLMISLDPSEFHPGWNPDKMVSNTDTHTDTNTNLPNDPLYLEGKQWNFDMIGMPRVWEKYPDINLGKDVIVAVVDTGVSDGQHSAKRVPDLSQTCILEGYNFVDDNTDAYDGMGHGTHVAGTIAQSTNNGIGVTGIAPQVCILPLKVLSDEGSGSVADIADGIYLATEANAKVINLSLGSPSASPVINKAIDHAFEHNIFLACAAGNGYKGIINYPAGHKGCHAISAINRSGELAYYSSYGKSTEGQELFIAAPGGEMKGPDDINDGIWQDTVDPEDITKHGYFPFQGTSMAAPHVAGVAALVISNLGEYKLSELEDILTSTATDKDDEFKFGKGIINAQEAVIKAKDIKYPKTSIPGSVILTFLAFTFVAIFIKIKKPK